MFSSFNAEEIQEIRKGFVANIRRKISEKAAETVLAEEKKAFLERCEDLKKKLETASDTDGWLAFERRAFQDIYESRFKFWKGVERDVRAEEKAKEAKAVKRIERKKQRQIAKNILARGVLSIEDVAECVELTVAEVRRLARASNPDAGR